MGLGIVESVCSHCRHSNPPGVRECLNCHASLPEPEAQATLAIAEDWSVASSLEALNNSAVLAAGSVVSDRYEILQLLGQGGMGTVYKARDRELDRLVALKVIRPELAGHPAILQRFKQELILARQVTHKNVIRIFDLGHSAGLKYITMEFVQGRDLAAVIAERRLTPEESVRIVRQVCRALEAAHAEGVIHRDLKPQNIMVDERNKVTVMDFGLARSMEMPGLTQTRAVLGTPDYMSPEQATGKPADARSDLFTLGVIFYELLTGQLPFQADSVVASLVKRTQQAPPPPIEVDASVPRPLSDVVQKCLAIDPAARYQSAEELAADLDAIAGGHPESSLAHLSTIRPPSANVVLPRRSSRRWVLAGVCLLLLAVAALVTRTVIVSRTAARPKPVVSLLVADFSNTTGDPVFDGTLESALNIDLEAAAFINAYNRGQARRIAGELRPNAGAMDEALARLVALREGINVVVTGSVTRRGEGYGVSVRAVDAATGKVLASRASDAADQAGVLKILAGLAAPIRKVLGDTTPESAQIAAAETYSASSLRAAHLYAVGQDALAMGKRDDAIRDFSEAVGIDPNFGRAYAGLAVTCMNLKRQQEAGDNFKKALSLLDRMTEREKYRTLGIYYLSFVRNYGQAIDTLRKLVYLYPADGVAYNNLSLAYAFTNNIPEALAASRRALEISPKNLQRRANFAGFSMLAGDFDTAISEAGRIVKENPAFETAHLPLALATLARGDVDGARQVYDRLEKLNARGFSLGKTGEADLELYLGRPREALPALEAGIAADQKTQSPGELAHKYVALAEAHLSLGDKGKAAEEAGKAAGLSPVESILFLAGRVAAQAGDETKARSLAASLENMLQSQTRSDAKLIAGEIALQRNRFPEALEAFRDGQKLRDSWISHFLLGRAYVETGHFAEALTELETCQKRRGEAADLFFADMTTLRYLPPLYYWLGRAQEGLGTKEAAGNSYREFLKLRVAADPGAPLVADAKKRSGD